MMKAKNFKDKQY